MLSAQLKLAGKQAYRYGRQASLLSNAEHIEHAYRQFIAQFKSEESADIIIGHIDLAYEKGRSGDTVLDAANNFTIETRNMFYVDAPKGAM